MSATRQGGKSIMPRNRKGTRTALLVDAMIKELDQVQIYSDEEDA